MLTEAGAELVLQEKGSGTNADRPEYQRLLKLIQAGTVAEVLAVRDDRLNRDQPEALHLLRLCRQNDTKLRLLEDSLWMATAADQLAQEEVWVDRSAAAAAESRKISSRLKRSYATAEKSGLTTVRKAPLGYRVQASQLHANHNPIGTTADGEMVSEWQAARKVVDLIIQEGSLRSGRNTWREWLMSLAPIGDGKRLTQLQRMHAASLGYWTEDPTIRGGRKARSYRQEYDATTRKFQWVKNEVVEVVWGQHQELITADELRRIQALKAANTNKAFQQSSTKSKWINIHRTFKCGHCGKGYTRVTSGKGTSQYYCTARQRDKNQCNAKGISHKRLVQELMKVLPNAAGRLLDSIGPTVDHSDQIAKLTSELDAIQGLLKTINNRAMQLEQSRLQEELKRLEHEQQQAQQTHQADLDEYLALQNPKFWEWLFQDPVGGHKQFNQWIEELTILDGKLHELKLQGQQPVFVEGLQDRIKGSTVQGWIKSGAIKPEPTPGKAVTDGPYITAKQMIDELNEGVPIAQP